MLQLTSIFACSNSRDCFNYLKALVNISALISPWGSQFEDQYSLVLLIKMILDNWHCLQLLAIVENYYRPTCTVLAVHASGYALTCMHLHTHLPAFLLDQYLCIPHGKVD